MTPTIPCSCCGGTGRIELTGEYRETLERVRLVGGEFTAAEVGRLMGVKNEAMCNRLAGLERMGFLTSRRFGRKRLFSVV